MTARDENDKDGMSQGDMHQEAKTSPGGSNRIRRLGMLELGWHAHEKTMPAKILSRIGAGEAIKVSNMISVLARACEQDPLVRSAYFCHSSVQYITKFKGEGSFCGYRNMQMMISYVVASKADGTKAFLDGIPTILQLQDLIENAWDQGINSDGRLETGGIRGTRKHIGTPEAQALFRSLGVPCKVARHDSSDAGRKAFYALLEHVESHFATGVSAESETKVHETNLPPIYLQRPRHSLTIVGFETYQNGKSDLLVLDPGLRPSPQVARAAAAAANGTAFDECISLSPYRRGKWDLGGYKQFETLTLAP